MTAKTQLRWFYSYTFVASKLTWTVSEHDKEMESWQAKFVSFNCSNYVMNFFQSVFSFLRTLSFLSRRANTSSGNEICWSKILFASVFLPSNALKNKKKTKNSLEEQTIPLFFAGKFWSSHSFRFRSDSQCTKKEELYEFEECTRKELIGLWGGSVDCPTQHISQTWIAEIS